jgi:hypothetical protein
MWTKKKIWLLENLVYLLSVKSSSRLVNTRKK